MIHISLSVRALREHWSRLQLTKSADPASLICGLRLAHFDCVACLATERALLLTRQSTSSHRRSSLKGSSEQCLSNAHSTIWHVALAEIKGNGNVFGKASAGLEHKDPAVITI
jgi:hypothetical protein